MLKKDVLKKQPCILLVRYTGLLRLYSAAEQLPFTYVHYG